ncbi:MAG: DUF3945 domain-containing protein [Rikenellaceae bacterium]
MAQELEQEKEVLLVDNKDSNQLEVVSKVDENGELKTVAPKQANEADFLKFDKRNNMLENFLVNYFAQAKNPKHTGLYRISMDGIEQVADAIKGLLNSGEEGKEFLSEYKVDTSKYEQNTTQQQATSKQENQEKKEQSKQTGYQAMDASKIDWDTFSKIGITKENLEKSGALNDMLNYRRSSELHQITIKVDNLTINTDARLSLRRTEDDKLIPVIHAIRKAPQLDRPFYGITFSAQDKTNLRKTGHLGRQIEIVNKKTGEVIPSYVSIDSKTNELIAYNAKNIRIPKEIKGVTLSEMQRASLLEGKPVEVEGMTSKNGKQFDAIIQVNAAEKGITFRFADELKQQRKLRADEGGVRIPNKIGGVDLTKENQTSLKNGEVIYVENMLDKKGEKYNAYIKVNEEQGKLDFFRWDPRKKQGVTADNNSATQVAVNSEGKNNEQSKHSTEPLKQGQNSNDKEPTLNQNKSKLKL